MKNWKKNHCIVYIVCFVLPLFSAVFCTGCFPVLDLEPRETSDLSVRQLIRKQNKATDPKKKWQKASSYYMKLKITRTDKETKEYHTSEVWYQHPKCFRLVTGKNGIPQKILVYNDGRIWNIDPRTHRSTELKSDSLEYCLFLNTVRMGTPYMDYTDIFRRISVDMFTENGVRYYRMICMSDDERIQPYIFYYNGGSFLQEKLETVNVISSSGASVLYSSTIQKYTQVDDIKLPSVTVVESGGVVQVSELEKIVINQKYPESMFLPEKPFTHRIAPPAGKNFSEGKKIAVKKSGEQKKEVKETSVKEKSTKETKNIVPAKKKERKWYDTFLE